MDSTIGGVSRYSHFAMTGPELDILTNHYYGNVDNLASDATKTLRFNKVFIAGEYGFGKDMAWYENVMQTTMNTPALSASLVWSLR
jgi:hypothetical protein